MKRLQVFVAATLLLAGLSVTASADQCCKSGNTNGSCCQKQGLKSGWFTGAGSMAAKADAKANDSCCKDKADAKAQESCGCKDKQQEQAACECGAKSKADCKCAH